MSKRNRTTVPVRPRRQCLRLERLEDRAVPAILGLVWKDSLGGGTQNGGEVAFGGVPITLYQDGGDMVFNNGGGDDILLGTVNSATDGTFNFSVGDGRYYVDIDRTNATVAPLALAVGADPAVVTIVNGADVTVSFGFRRQSPPPVTVAAGTQAPGAFPTRASGAIVNIAPVSGSTLGGTGSDNLRVEFVAAGPFNWTESRHNEGDVSMSIGPALPADPSSYPPATFENFAAGATSPTTWAWRVSKEVGLSFATVHANGFDNGDVISGGAPVGPMFGVAYFNTDASGGLGYNPVDGTQRSGGNSSDLTMGLAGTPDEGSFNVAVAHFPFDEGWVGGHVSDQITQAGEAVFDQGFASPGLSPSVVTWPDFNVGRATVNLTGFRPDFNPANGMLFVSPNAGDNNTNIIAALPSGTGWNIAVREDNNLDTSGNTFANQPDSEFQFMYVDYRYQGVIGARVNGSTGATIQGAGGYTLTRLATGSYALTIPGEVDTSGMLLLTVSGAQAGDPTLPSRAFLSYSFDAINNRFLIQSRELTAGGNPFGQAATLVDADFSFAWLDFAAPMTPVIPVAAPTVAGVQVNQPNTTQRSEVRSIAVTFSGPVTFANNNPAAAFQLTRVTGQGGTVGLNAAVSTNGLGQTVVTLTFNGTTAIDPVSLGNNGVPSLADGRYQLTILDNTVFAGNVALDGDNNGTAGGAFVSPTDTANGGQGQLRLYRLFGDATGNGVVDLADLAAFRGTFNATVNNPGFLDYLDADNSGVVDLSDLSEFRSRFNASVFV